MTILNLMLGKKRGGLEQAALDYAEALKLANIPALTVASPGAWVAAQLASANVAHESLTNYGNWDRLAAWRLRMIAKRTNATAIICHGNRAVAIALRALSGHIPVIAVAHNYSTRRFAKADMCFAITQHVKDHLMQGGAKTILVMPNMVRLPETTARPAFRTPPVIGSMGRFVAKKGFNHYIEALSVLRARGVAFSAILGGEGEEAEALAELITRYQLQDVVTLSGWVQNKAAFFAGIDIFVLPSLHEPFGIVLIEAMSHGLPVISTASEGPREIMHDGSDGVLTPIGDREKLADAMQRLIADPALAASLGSAGAALVTKEYSMQAMAGRLKNALAALI